MLVEELRSRPDTVEHAPVRSRPDEAFAARRRLIALRDDLVAAAHRERRGQWGEPPVFFFDRDRQVELEAARPATSPVGPHPLADRIAAEIAVMCESVNVRRAA